MYINNIFSITILFLCRMEVEKPDLVSKEMVYAAIPQMALKFYEQNVGWADDDM